MPILGAGLHILVAALFAIHAVRTRQASQWLFILFAFPLLGSLAYFFAVYLPNSRLERQALKAVGAAVKAIDPQREVRTARAAFEDTPTAQNQMRLAAALLEVGESQEAATLYTRCLQGPFANDPEIRLGAARAFEAAQRPADALTHLEVVKAERPDYRTDTVALVEARCLAALGRRAEARSAFEAAERRHGTWETKAEFAIFAWATGDTATAERLDEELRKIAARWNRLTRELNEGTLHRLDAARTLARRGA